jgi:hypothetical protein
MPPAPSTPSQPANPVFVNRPITGQEWCEYLFQDGFIYRIVAPKALYTRKDDDRSVRVVDMEGVSHYVPGDYRIARWKTKPGFPEVAF